MNKHILPKNALISVFYKDGLAPIVEQLNRLGVNIYSTGAPDVASGGKIPLIFALLNAKIAKT